MGHDARGEAEELRQAVREAHEVLKDLRAALREAQAWEQGRLAQDVIDDRIRQAVITGLKQYDIAITSAIKIASDGVQQRFSELEALFLGEDRKSRRKGKPSLPQLIELRTVMDTLQEESAKIPEITQEQGRTA
jgi:hypothetical protein